MLYSLSMNKETATLAPAKGDTFQYRLRGDRSQYVYLGQYAQLGYSVTLSVRAGKTDAATFATKIAALDLTVPANVLQARFARLGLELAAKYPAANAFGESNATNDGILLALAEAEAEAFPPAAPAREAQPDACRHGISYKATCAACEAD